MPKLVLFFSGLCGFVPNTANNRVRVNLVDAGTAHVAHLPVLKVRNQIVIRDASNPQLRVPDRTFTSPNGTKWALFQLDDEELTVSSAQDNALHIDDTDIGTCEPANPCCPTEGNRDSFRWIAPMESISSGSGRAHPIRDPLSPTVVARASLTEGDLVTDSFARDNADIALWRFLAGKSPAPIMQALADVVRYDGPTIGNTVDLVTTNMRTAATPRKIRLTRFGGGDALALVLNQPLDSIEERVPTLAPAKPNMHFSHLYDLSASPGPRRFPHPLGRHCRKLSTPPNVETPFCPPSWFEADPDAYVRHEFLTGKAPISRSPVHSWSVPVNEGFLTGHGACRISVIASIALPGVRKSSH